MAPADVTDHNQKKVWEKLYGGHYPTSDSFQFQVGDQVRLPRAKGQFEQGFYRTGLMRSLYSWELQPVRKSIDMYFKIEKI